MIDSDPLSRRVLVLTPTGADAQIAASLLAEAAIESVICDSIVELCDRFSEGAGAMLIAEEGLHSPEIDCLTGALQEQPPWSDIPLIVLTTADDTEQSTERLVGLFASVGSMTLLERPFRSATLLSAIQVAMRARQKQYQSRRLIEQAASAALELTRSQERLSLAIESSKMGMWTLSMPSLELDASPRCREMFGVPEGRPFTYRELVDAVHPDDRLRMHDAVAAALTDGIGYDLEHRILRADGSVRWVALRGRAFFDSRGAPSFMTGTSLDITDRKNAESLRERLLGAERAARSAAERANELKDEFLATLSHELRTPLTAVLGWTQVLKRLGAASQEQLRAVVAIERNAIAQKRLIEDLLDMSSISAGTFELEHERVSMDAIVDAAVDSVAGLAHERNISLQRALSATSHIVVGDRRRLQQVVWNLLTNAIKFSPRSAAVHVSLEQAEGGVRLTVSDAGVGIEPDFLPHVFERFRQQDGSTRRAHGGLGLGLGIVKHLVELHGGRVRAESEGSGGGATFAVWLPLAPEAPAVERAAAPPQPRAQAARKDASADTPATASR